MADILKRDFDIITLKAELGQWPGRRRGNSDELRFTLQFHQDGGALQDGPCWYAPLSAIEPIEQLNSRNSQGSGPALQLPQSLVDGLRDWFQSDAEGNPPLWIHLVKPYGRLGLVPWERLLGKALQVPILMLPDFLFPPPREAAATLDVVVCGSAPLGHESALTQEAVRQAVDRILSVNVSGRRLRIHVFVDRDMVGPLGAHWKAQGRGDSEVILYPQESAAPYVEEDPSSRLLDQSGALRSPWLLWMREVLSGRSVDVVHFVCYGYFTRERGALLFAQSPLERSERFLAGPVSACELQTFMTQVGAWSCVFTSPLDNCSEPGLRALADEIAQTRPGPMMMHTLREDSSADALAAGYEFLYSLEQRPAPQSTALFIYCQPYLTADNLRARRERTTPRTLGISSANIARNIAQHKTAELSLAGSALDNLFDSAENAPAWVASTERFAEQVQLHYQQLARDEILPSGLCERETNAALDTVDKLREAVAAQERKSNEEEGGAAAAAALQSNGGAAQA